MKELNALQAFLLAVGILLSLATVAADDNAKDMFIRPFDDVQTCHETNGDCQSCFTKCPRQRTTFFNSRTSIGYIPYPEFLYHCRSNISNFRTGMEPWCLNNDHRFYASDDFVVNHENCSHVDAGTCSTNLLDEFHLRATHGAIKWNSDYLIVAKKIRETSTLYEEMEVERLKFQKEDDNYKKLNKLYDENILKEMSDHLRNPEETHTRFNDPVYKNLAKKQKMLKELKYWFGRNNLTEAQLQVKRTRKWTATLTRKRRIRMKTLPTTIFSHPDKVKAYMVEIKSLIDQVSVSQESAVEFPFESARSTSINKEMYTLDNDFIKRRDILRKSQQQMRSEMIRTSKQKLRLVQAIRQMIKTISTVQKENNCGSNSFT